MVHHQQLPANPPTKQNIKAWWNQFGFVQKSKKDTTVEYTYYQRMCLRAPHLSFWSLLFPLTELSFVLSTRPSGSSRLWKTFKRQPAICKCSNINSKCEWRSLCLGLHPSGRREMVCITSFPTLITHFLFVAITIVVFISRKTVRSYCFL